MTFRPNAFASAGDMSFSFDDRAGRDLASLNYILLVLGFFTGITAFAAVALAYWRRHRSFGMARSHLDWQIRIFWHGVLAFLAIGTLHAVIIGLGAVTFGIGLVFLVIPWGLGVLWLVWTVWAILRGMRLLNRGLPIR